MRILVLLAAVSLAPVTACENDSAKLDALQSNVVPMQAGGQSPELACYQMAERETNLSDYQARTLCKDASSTGPATCYLRSEAVLEYSKAQGIQLCRCAGGVQPVQCARRALDETDLSKHEVLSMCSARSARQLRDNCTPFGG